MCDPAHQRHHRPGVDALQEQEGGGRVASVVEASRAHAGLREQRVPPPGVAVGIEGRAVRGREDEVVVLPPPAHLKAVFELLQSMDLERGAQGRWQDDGSQAGLRLRFVEDEPTAHTPRAVRAALAAAGLGTCVSPGEARHRPANVEQPALGIDVGPAQRKDLAASQAKAERDQPCRPVLLALGSSQDLLGLLVGQSARSPRRRIAERL